MAKKKMTNQELVDQKKKDLEELIVSNVNNPDRVEVISKAFKKDPLLALAVVYSQAGSQAGFLKDSDIKVSAVVLSAVEAMNDMLNANPKAWGDAKMVAKQNKKIKALRETNQSQQKTIQKITDDLANEKENVRLALSKNKDLWDRIQELEAQHENDVENVTSFSKAYGKISKAAEGLESWFKEFSSNSNQVKTDTSDDSVNADTWKDAVDKAQAIKDAIKLLSEQQAQIKQLQKEVDSYSSANSEYQKEIKEQASNIAKLQNKLDTLQDSRLPAVINNAFDTNQWEDIVNSIIKETNIDISDVQDIYDPETFISVVSDALNETADNYESYKNVMIEANNNIGKLTERLNNVQEQKVKAEKGQKKAEKGQKVATIVAAAAVVAGAVGTISGVSSCNVEHGKYIDANNKYIEANDKYEQVNADYNGLVGSIKEAFNTLNISSTALENEADETLSSQGKDKKTAAQEAGKSKAASNNTDIVEYEDFADATSAINFIVSYENSLSSTLKEVNADYDELDKTNKDLTTSNSDKQKALENVKTSLGNFYAVANISTKALPEGTEFDVTINKQQYTINLSSEADKNATIIGVDHFASLADAANYATYHVSNLNGTIDTMETEINDAYDYLNTKYKEVGILEKNITALEYQDLLSKQGKDKLKNDDTQEIVEAYDLKDLSTAISFLHDYLESDAVTQLKAFYDGFKLPESYIDDYSALTDTQKTAIKNKDINDTLEYDDFDIEDFDTLVAAKDFAQDFVNNKLSSYLDSIKGQTTTVVVSDLNDLFAKVQISAQFLQNDNGSINWSSSNYVISLSEGGQNKYKDYSDAVADEDYNTAATYVIEYTDFEDKTSAINFISAYVNEYVPMQIADLNKTITDLQEIKQEYTDLMGSNKPAQNETNNDDNKDVSDNDNVSEGSSTGKGENGTSADSVTDGNGRG